MSQRQLSLSKQQADSEAQNDSNRLVVVGYVLSTFKLPLINVWGQDLPVGDAANL